VITVIHFLHPADPSGLRQEGCRWDTWRNCEFNEILAFYGLHYWYTWQVSILGLGPIWMSPNEEAKKRAARLLRREKCFAFGLSEREHGADIYSTSMTLTPRGRGGYVANGEKYYIGNGNVAEMVSTFGKMEGTGDYIFFAANYKHKNYDLVKNVVNSQSYVADFILRDYPVTGEDILSRGPGSLGQCLEHRQYRQIQPGLGFHRHLHPCFL
jgi:acyl-CoA dehydrogenase